MRCPSCGTENAPDSRFCGGCGARLSSTESRVAPTHKISDDAPYPKYTTNPPPSVHVPMAMPTPVALGRASTDPVEPRRPTPVPQQARPQVSSVVLPRQGRRWGLVIAILVIDVGLAAGGAVLLTQGLRDDKPPPPPLPTTATVKTSDAAPPPTTATVKTSDAAPPAPPVPMRVGKAIVKARAAPPPPPAPAPAKVVAGKKPGKPTPVDPYAGSSSPPAGSLAAIADDSDHSAAISDAIDAKSSHAESVFSRCYTQATKPLPADQPLKGRIQIAFTVLANGHVGNVTTAENQTGSDQLANCLASEIGGWIFNEHPQDPMEITKIFAFGPSSS
jgi:hypothetical protein